MEFNCLMWIPVYIHSANIPISLHFLSRHSWHFLRMYMSITQLPPFLHLYTAFLVMLLLKKPTEETQKGEKKLLTSSTQKTHGDWVMPEHFLMKPWRDHRQSSSILGTKMWHCIIQKPAGFNLFLKNKDTFELQPLLGKILVCFFR